nr:exosortase B [uncultured Duganella sp.]
MHKPLSMPTPLVRAALWPWAAILAGLLALYLPSFIDLFHGAWGSEKNAHGPIVMGVAFAFLYFRVRQLLSLDQFERRPAPLAGAALLAAGLACYALGRSQGVLILEVGSLILVLSGITVAAFGLRTWRRMWFAFFFMLFMIPLPPSIVDMLTLPLKIAVSYATEHLLYWLGYPIARSGVILTIGPYQLLVADACAGLNSLFTLEALGLLYMNLVRHQSVVRNVVLATLIVPISFAANTIRIVFLSLITFYLGDAAGQGFLHGFSGMVLFLSALGLIIAVDSALNWIVSRGKKATPSAPAMPVVPPGMWAGLAGVRGAAGAAMLAAMLATVAVAHWMTPVLTAGRAIGSLEHDVPRAFGDWREVPGAAAQAHLSTGDEGQALSDQIYDQVVMRTYVNGAGARVMLALAYAKEQRQEVKLHLPEICYPAQGYKVIALTPAALEVGAGAALPGKQMLAAGGGRTEAVTYWTRVGDGYPQGGLAMRMQIFRDGLAGKVDDAILVRASSLIGADADAPAAYALQRQFLAALVAASAGGALVAAPGAHP